MQKEYVFRDMDEIQSLSQPVPIIFRNKITCTMFGSTIKSSRLLVPPHEEQKKSVSSILKRLDEDQMIQQAFKICWKRLEQIVHPHISFLNYQPHPITKEGKQLMKSRKFISYWLRVLKQCPFVCFPMLARMYEEQTQEGSWEMIEQSAEMGNREWGQYNEMRESGGWQRQCKLKRNMIMSQMLGKLEQVCTQTESQAYQQTI